MWRYPKMEDPQSPSITLKFPQKSGALQNIPSKKHGFHARLVVLNWYD
jgi:hypothetical protein